MKSIRLAPVKVPKALTTAIVDACKKLAPDCHPQFIERRPETSAVINKCTFNVRSYLDAHPSEMVMGWEVCIWEGVMLECIGHSVVRTDGALVCISPSAYGDQNLLFLPDPRLVFDFNDPMARMPTKQIAISQRPEVHRLIEVEAAELAIKIKYPVSTGTLVVGGEDANLLSTFAREKQRLMLKIVLATNDHASKCFCGSGKKFRKCHQADIEHMLRFS